MIKQLPAFFNRYNTVILICIIVIPTLIYDRINRWGYVTRPKGIWTETINSDGCGYYEYLRSIFIYHDFSYHYIGTKEDITNRSNISSYYLSNINGHKVNRYFAGTALLVSPFFLIVLAVEKLFHASVTGYEMPFQLATSIAALFYLVLGLYWLKKLLTLNKVRNEIILIVSVAYVFGSNMFFYLTRSPMMSHMYSFSVLIGFMYYFKRFSLEKDPRLLIILSVLIGIALLIRPTNAMIILVTPYICGTWQSFKDTFLSFFKKPGYLLSSILIVLLLVFVQLYFYYIQTGHFIVWSYQGFYFDFLKPHIREDLFGYNKGNFVYVPVTFFSIVSLLYFVRKNVFQFVTGILFFLVIVYVFSCYSMWNNGASYGIRFLIDFYGFLALQLALFLSRIEKYKSYFYSYLFLILLCIIYDQIQIYQYNKYILHHVDMNKERFWEVFLKTQHRYYGIFYTPQFDSSKVDHSYTYNFDFDKDSTLHDLKNVTFGYITNNSSRLAKVDRDHSGFTYKVYLHQFCSQNTPMFIHVKMGVYQVNKRNNCSLQLRVRDDSTVYSWDKRIIREYVKGKKKWEEFSCYKYIPELHSEKDYLNMFFTNNGNAVYIDDLELGIYVMKNEK